MASVLFREVGGSSGTNLDSTEPNDVSHGNSWSEARSFPDITRSGGGVSFSTNAAVNIDAGSQTDYTFNITYDDDGSGDDFFVFWRMSSLTAKTADGDLFWFRVSPGRAVKANLVRQDAGTDTTLADSTDTLATGNTMTVTVEVVGDTFTCKVDDGTNPEISISTTDSTYSANTIVGMQTFSSNSVTKYEVTIPSTAPTLSNPSGTATGSSTADGSVDTDTDSGTLYWVVTTSSTAPSATQIKNGQDHTGSTAADSGSQTVGSA